MDRRKHSNNRVGLADKDLDRFLTKFEQKGPDDCWLWKGRLDRAGYGHFVIDYRPYPAHRVSYMLAVGEIPKGAQVHHKCERPACINPDHLEALAPKDHARASSGHGVNKTHCKRGHEFTPANTYLRNGNRCCRACRALYLRKKHYPEDAGTESRRFSKLYWPLYCKQGHPLFGDNQQLFVRRDGYTIRHCKTCRRKSALAYARRNRKKVLTAKANRRSNERSQRTKDRAAELRALAKKAKSMSDSELVAEFRKVFKEKRQ
jgi:hypothetical protein